MTTPTAPRADLPIPLHCGEGCPFLACKPCPYASPEAFARALEENR